MMNEMNITKKDLKETKKLTNRNYFKHQLGEIGGMIAVGTGTRFVQTALKGTATKNPAANVAIGLTGVIMGVGGLSFAHDQQVKCSADYKELVEIEQMARLLSE